MNRLIIGFILIFGWSGCEKVSSEKEWTVTYTTYRKSLDPISYRVQYVTNSGATEYKGPFTNENFQSREIEGFEDGSYQYIKLETISGKGEIRVRINVNGSVYEEGIKGEFEKEFELESNL